MAGRRLRAVREAWDAKGSLNQAWFAQRIGATRTQLANWEAGRLPDPRAMVRLYLEFGIPTDWIYLGQLARVDYDLAERLREKAASLGAVVNAPIAEWPMQIERQPGIRAARRPGAVPRGPAPRVLHDKPTPAHARPAKS